MIRLKRIIYFLLTLVMTATSINTYRQFSFAENSQKYELGGAETYYDNKDYYEDIKGSLPRINGQPAPPTRIVKGNTLPLNYRLFLQKGILVYGTYRSVSNNRFKCGYQDGINTQTGFPNTFLGGYYSVSLTQYICSDHGKVCPSRTGDTVRGEWQYFGYDYNGNPSSNMWFRNDANVTQFNQRQWIEEPWRTEYRPETQLYNGISVWNGYAYDQYRGGTVRTWIGDTLKDWGGVPTLTGLDPEVYKYLYVQSPPTIMYSGSGRMWHQRPEKKWYQTLSVPKLTTKQSPDVTVEILSITGNYNKSTATTLISLPEDTSKDNEKISVDIKLKATIKDEAYYGDQVQETIYYTRKDIKYWNFTINLLNKDYKVTNIPINSKSDNTKTYEFVSTITLTYAQIRGLTSISRGNAYATPTYENNVLGKRGNSEFYVGNSIIFDKPDEDITKIRVEVPTLQIGNSIPEIAFDNIPFSGPVDSTDMSLVTSKEVYVNGSPVDYNTFFSGNYIFPRTYDRNGYLAMVEIIYHLDKNALIAEGVTPEEKARIASLTVWDYKSTDVVYVYPTKPYAHFTLSSNSWKQNRIINVTNDSPSSNIQLVLNNFPITQYRWSYGGDTSKLHYGTNTDLQKQLQYSQSGTYSLTLEAQNSIGQWGDPYTVNFTVLEDYAPNIEVNLTDSVITRQDTIKSWQYGITSTDGDKITSARIELWYDSDNNGTVDTKLQTWDGLGGNGICEKEDFPAYTPNKLGYYVYRIYANEDFVAVPGQDSLTQFVNASDKKTGYYQVEWWVDNYQPLSDIYIDAPIQRPKVDLFIMLDKNLSDSNRETVIQQRVNIENFLLGQNIIPNVNMWDLKTYVYSQPASTVINTGTTYPSDSITYESNGYSGTLNLQLPVADNGGYVDYGYWGSSTESISYSEKQQNSITATSKYDGSSWVWQSGSGSQLPSTIDKSYNGYSGTLTKGSGYEVSRSPSYPSSPKKGDTITQTVTWECEYSGTLYKTVPVWVPDLRWVSNYYGTYTGTIYKSVKQPYTDPYTGDSIKYILYLSDNNISEPADYQSAISKADAEIILAGQDAIKTQSTSDFFINVSGKTVTQVIDEALNYIKNASPAIEEIYLLQGQNFTLNLAEFDLENDTIVDRQLQYVHEANFFDNPTGQEPGTATVFSDTGSWTTTIRDHFDNVGRYRIFRRVKDLPSGTIGSSYSYYSGATEVDIYVHRKPIADAVLDWKYNTSTGQCETVWVDKSYDLDHTSLPTKGIVERKIMFRKDGGEWQYYIPSTLTYGTYDVQYYVKDMEGVWSDPWVKTFALDNSPQFQAQLRAKDSTFTINSIPASEYLEAYSMWSRHPGTLRLEMLLSPPVSGLPAQRIINYSAGNTGVPLGGQDISWFNQTYQIPDIFPDGDRTFTISARDVLSGLATTRTFTVNVYTPINLLPGIPNQSFRANNAMQITASTSKYPMSTVVQMQYGTAYQSSSINMAGTVSGYSKNWSVAYTIPNSVPDGTYTARFLSTNPSGKQEVKTCTYTVTHNSPPAVSITGTSPSYVYEGDDVRLNYTVNDPDLQTLNCSIRITRGPATVWTGTSTVNPVGGTYQAQSIMTQQDIAPGSYTASITATDTYGETATSTYNFTVNTLGITGFVNHTPEWEINRQKYNTAALAAGKPTHSPDTYFSGERYVLHADTTVINPLSGVSANIVRVSIVGNGYSATLSKTGSNQFDGELWDEAMMNWGDRTVDFLFEVTYSNGTVKTNTVRTYIKDDEYWRVHREF